LGSRSAGQDGSSSGIGGGGGGGGGAAGVSFFDVLFDQMFSISSADTPHGFNGGKGGESFALPGGAGGGGAGGFGILFEDCSSQTVTNQGIISGGNGGDGGAIDGPGFAGDGGDGGTGLLFLISSGSITGGNGGATIINSGTITGGNGGAAGTVIAGHPGHAGAGGAGIAGANLTIIDGGKIAGGLSGDGVQADAIDFIGGVNSLTLEAGYSIIGNVVAFSTADSLVLGGDADGTFALSSLTQFIGFGLFEKTGLSTWTLTGTTSADTPWTITSGVLAVSSDGNLGNDTNSTIDELSFDGGTLKFLADFTTGRQIVLNTNGTFDTSGHNATLAGLISGDGELIKIDAGVLTLSHSNAYSGGTLLNGGTLDVAVLGAAGAGQITFGAGTEILKIENPALSHLTGTLNSFGDPIQVTAVGDIIDLTGLSFAKHAKVSYSPKTDILSLTSGGVTDMLTVVAPHGATFALSSDGSHGTDITLIGIANTGHLHA
jgi:autotransporter-associated beta strand protein